LIVDSHARFVGSHATAAGLPIGKRLVRVREPVNAVDRLSWQLTSEAGVQA